MPALIEYQKRAARFLEKVTPARIGSAACAIVAKRRHERNPRYSACADLAHAMYEALGLSHEAINRDDPSTVYNEWRMGLNVSLLAWWQDVARDPPRTIEAWDAVDGGDVLICWGHPSGKDAHVVCVIANHGDGTLSTAEYGQGRPTVGRLKVQTFEGSARRPWKKWLPLADVLAACGVELDELEAEADG